MVLFIILGVVVLITLVVIGMLFLMLGKEGKKEEVAVPIPVKEYSQIKKEIYTPAPQQPNSKILKEVPPEAFIPKVTLPTQSTQTLYGDNAYKHRFQELEDELLNISKKAESQSYEARVMIENLSKENELLKKEKVDLEAAQQKLNELQSEASGLKIQNDSLQTQIEETNAKVRLLEDQMMAVKLQMGEEISRANAAVTELTREKEILLAAPKPIPDEALHRELDALKSEHNQLQQKYKDMERIQQKLRELNAHLIEKNEAMQYELIKARAQSSGLERVSFNYKNQLEDFLKKTHEMKNSNDELSQVKNRLEGTLEEIKQKNEELLKKDQLAQFELEKNRTRLVALEREYEDFKAQQQQKNQ